jgi:hypothetical protein
MYPIDVERMIRRETLGSRALDPTLPYRPSRFRRLRAVVRSVDGSRVRREPAQRAASSRAC